MNLRTLIAAALTAVVALLATACGDGADGELTDDDAAESTEQAAGADDEADGSDEAEAGSDGAGAADLPDEWPEELPVHDGVEIGRTIVEERDDGSVRIDLQYRTDESIEEANEYLAGLADHGWDVEVNDVEEDGGTEFTGATLEGFGWRVTVSADRPRGSQVLYTYGASEQE